MIVYYSEYWVCTVVPHTQLLYAHQQWPIFIVEKYDGGVQKPSQSIKIYRKSLKNFTKFHQVIARDAEAILL